MSASSEKSFCPSRKHKKHIPEVHKFQTILKQKKCRMDHLVLPTKKRNCHWQVPFPRLGCGVDARKGGRAFVGASDGSFGSLPPCGRWNTLLWNKTPLTRRAHWILGLPKVYVKESQVKESGRRGAREERGHFRMRFEMRSWVDEVKTQWMAVPDDRNCGRCHRLSLKREKNVKG